MRTIHLKIGGRDVALEASRDGSTLLLRHEDGREVAFEVIERGSELLLRTDEGTTRLFMHREGENVYVAREGEPRSALRWHPEAGGAEENDASAADITAPMNGRVVSVLTEAGQELAEGDGVVVIEAMKMEHKLTAPFAARVETLSCEEGQQVDMNELLAHLVRLDAE